MAQALARAYHNLRPSSNNRSCGANILISRTNLNHTKSKSVLSCSTMTKHKRKREANQSNATTEPQHITGALRAIPPSQVRAHVLVLECVGCKARQQIPVPQGVVQAYTHYKQVPVQCSQCGQRMWVGRSMVTLR